MATPREAKGAAGTGAGVEADIVTLDLSLASDVEINSTVLASQLGAACKSHGFFAVTNHGVPPAVIARAYAAAESFFALDEDKKMTVLANASSRGYTPFLEETLDPATQKKGDTKEGYYIGREIPAAEFEQHPHALQGHNVWPDEAVLGLDGWKAAMGDYFSALHALGVKLLRLVALSLDLAADFFDADFTRPMEMLRLLRYGDDVSAPDDGVLGCGAHTDYGMLTLLSTDDVPGLEIYVEAAKAWMAVAPRPGDFIVNIGDMLERWTNRTYRSTLHRVVNRSGRRRFSIPFFFEPNFETVVSCLPGLLAAGEAPTFEPITSGEHLLAKYRATHAMRDPSIMEANGAVDGVPV